MISKKNKPYLTVIKSYLVMFQKVAQSAENHTQCNEVIDPSLSPWGQIH